MLLFDMQKLLSLPQNLVAGFHEITGNSPENWFVLADPQGAKIGSGGGTAYLLAEYKRQSGNRAAFSSYIAATKKIIIHAGGQSRRLPAYAPSGKVLTPIPVFRWSRGQRLDQTLLDLQIPLLEKIMEVSLPGQNTLIAAGDVLIQSPEVPFVLPDADVVCFGIWADPHLASRHGVFFTPRNNPEQLDFMIQKPGHEVIERLSGTHLYLMDIGIWVLSDRAVEVLMKKCGWDGSGFINKIPDFIDLYSTFGISLGLHSSAPDAEISMLSSAIVPMNKGEFYHYGTSPELINSTEKIQNRVQDQRNIWHYRIKPHPSIFVQNAISEIKWDFQHHHIWIENSHVPASWKMSHNHVITGSPVNNWNLALDPGICLDIIPIGTEEYCVRPYGMDDPFRGQINEVSTVWMGKPVMRWLQERDITPEEAGLEANCDIQVTPLFPVIKIDANTEDLLKWMLGGNSDKSQKVIWLTSFRLSADQISNRANLKRLFSQRAVFSKNILKKLAANYRRSVFYQADL
jgi:hypothetical protein